MGRKLKKLTSVCLAVIMIVSVLVVAPFTAGAVTADSDSVSAISGDFEYETYDGETATITAYNGNATELDIPSKIDGYTVTEIYVYAFEGCTSLKSITIPDGVTEIGSGAFEGCKSLTNVSIPDSMESIDWCAFRNCPKFTSVTIPGNVLYIREQAFGYIWDEDEWEYKTIDGFTIYGYTNSLAELYAYENGFNFVSIGEISPFKYEVLDDKTAVIIRYTGNEAEVVIPSEIDGNTVTGISWSAFENNTKLVSATIPDGVTYIGAYAFSNCTNLNHITIPDSVTDIDWGAFANCPNLTSVTIPGNVIYIKEHAFGYLLDEDEWEYEAMDEFTIYGYANSLAELYAYENGFKFVSIGEVSPLRYEVIDDGAAVITRYTGSETNLSIPSELDGYTITKIGDWAFESCTTLTSVIIPDGVGTIGWGAFANCRNLKSVIIPNRVKEIDWWAFYGSPNLTSITIPESVEYIGEYAFGYILDEDEWEYKPMDGFTIYGYTGSSAQEYANENGFNFVSIGEMLPFRYEVLDDETAIITRYIGRATDLVIPPEIDGYTVTEIGRYAFEDNRKLVSVTIPDGVTYIGFRAFANCTNIKSIIIPDSVESISSAVFLGCTSIESLSIPNGVKEIGFSAFEGCTSLKNVTIPNRVSKIEGWSFFDCPSLKSITIPDSVKYIGDNAFGYIFDKDKLEYKPMDGFTIYGYTGSAAEEYANENGFTFISLGDAPIPRLGDVNGDGKINIDDVTDIQKYVANMLSFTEKQEELADVDKDGKVSIDDVTLIQKYLAGMATI